jgi:hypothetical protein
MSELYPFVVPMLDEVYTWDNAFEIPTLDLNLQAHSIIGKFRLWGKQSRKTIYPGDTYGFYCWDEKFSALVKHPEAIPLTQITAIIEPNFSTSSRMPLPVGLYGIYLKRKIACYCQRQKIQVIVDLTVDPKFAELNLIGVPDGWQSYACRATRAFGPQFLLDNWQLAQDKAQTHTPYYFVYGGGKQVKQLADEYHWDWEPEYMTQFKVDRANLPCQQDTVEQGDQGIA